jgi:hypothetical protein
LILAGVLFPQCALAFIALNLNSAPTNTTPPQVARINLVTYPIDANHSVVYKPNVESPKPTGHEDGVSGISGPLGHSTAHHSIRATTAVSLEALRQRLSSWNSPLEDQASLLLRSPYWSTILGICAIEEYHCSVLPGGNNWNLWGIGGAGGLQFYATPEEGIAAINDWLAAHEATYPTIESLNGYYVVPASANWQSVVISVKSELESLP